MTNPPETATATFCATLVDEWVRCGVTDAVVAPGSRSTPLALALAADGRLRLHVHVDERDAGFVALGLGLATGRPAVVLTTSGTAAVELHPAVVEAHHSRVPLVCCTADRPPELQHVGAPQTIDQTRLFGTSVRWFVDPGVPDQDAAGSWRSLAARAVAEATGAPAGPVQVNLPFRDPLVGRPGDLPAARADGPWHRPVRSGSTVDPSALGAVVDACVSRRGVIVAGRVAGPGLDPDAVHAMARALGWPVVADPRSGCRVPASTTVCHADALVRSEGWAVAHAPEVVLQLGEPPASKVLGQWLAASGSRTVAVDPDGWWFDADRRADLVVAADPSPLARTVGGSLRPIDAVDAAWCRAWIDADRRAGEAIETELAAADDPTEPGIARAVLSGLPDSASLVVASSMPVRDVEWYGAARRGVRVLSNRGANGIDGVTSTAVGVALSGAPTAALLGDVAFLHDTNGLLGLARRSLDLVIVVVDNRGGGIFSFLPQADQVDHERFELLFGTPQDVDVAELAAAHGIPAVEAHTSDEVGSLVRGGLAAGGVHLVVARTDRASNVAVHDRLHRAVAGAIDPSGSGAHQR